MPGAFIPLLALSNDIAYFAKLILQYLERILVFREGCYEQKLFGPSSGCYQMHTVTLLLLNGIPCRGVGGITVRPALTLVSHVVDFPFLNSCNFFPFQLMILVLAIGNLLLYWREIVHGWRSSCSIVTLLRFAAVLYSIFTTCGLNSGLE